MNHAPNILSPNLMFYTPYFYHLTRILIKKPYDFEMCSDPGIL